MLKWYQEMHKCKWDLLPDVEGCKKKGENVNNPIRKYMNVRQEMRKCKWDLVPDAVKCKNQCEQCDQSNQEMLECKWNQEMRKCKWNLVAGAVK